ncbi:hypothetical protein DXV75_05635 [Alteromonas aestuariivivens]|uniref:Uncharacterized protein n=1 Tax=Alteromonas aestuariivivens TaxID=1938339 RepID=A0A3D8MB80_9ALTE|nr:hypothetical protein [Alteromonas aestuariivivens]RDV27508.1 hypothetical protein DXV75_05635 [Alteromonas aestuariivivens]
MKTAGNSEQLIARARLTVTQHEKAVFLNLASRDTAELYLNGDKIWRNPAANEYLLGKFDLTPFVRPGANMLVIKVFSNSHSSPALLQAFVESKRMGSSEVQPVALQWEVAANAQNNQYLAPWGKHVYGSGNWAPPTLVKMPDSLAPGHSGFPVSTNTGNAMGDWFWSNNPIDQTLELNRSLFVSQGDELYMGIAIDGSYEIRINQATAAIFAGHPNAVQYHDLSSFLRRGYNRIDIYLQSKVFQPQAAIIGYLYTLEGQQDLSQIEFWEADHEILYHGKLAESPPGVRFRPVKQATLNSRVIVTNLLVNAFPLILAFLCCVLIKSLLQGFKIRDSIESITGVALVLCLGGILLMLLQIAGLALPTILLPYIGLFSAMLLCLSLLVTKQEKITDGN